MKLGLQQTIQTSRVLNMRPQMQQALKMLQMSGVELVESVSEYVQNNPALEYESEFEVELASNQAVSDGNMHGLQANNEDISYDVRDPHTKSNDYSHSDGSYSPDSYEDFIKHTEDSTKSRSTDELLWLADGVSDATGDQGWRCEEAFVAYENALDAAWESVAAAPLTLKQHLTQQLNLTSCTPREKACGIEMIDAIDESGYFTQDIAEFAASIGMMPVEVLSVLDMLRGFEPTGVFARDLSDCLSIQLRERASLSKTAQQVLTHLELVAEGNLERIATEIGTNIREIRSIVKLILSLDPKPGASYTAENMIVSSADVIVRQIPNGHWKIELSRAASPQVVIRPEALRWRRALTRSADTKAKTYVKDCLEQAQWLTRTLQQRSDTLLRVMTEILAQQDGFFAYGITALRPITLQDVANQLDMHESTVSRAVSNKFVSTPFGIFKIREFFSSGVTSNQQEDRVATLAVQQRIKQLVENEPGDKPLSDSKITRMLQSDGLDIARRTVTKYRENAGIGSSVLRRKDKSKFQF